MPSLFDTTFNPMNDDEQAKNWLLLAGTFGITIISFFIILHRWVHSEKNTPPAIDNDMAKKNLIASYKCSINLEIMCDPVTTATGSTYERREIKAWLINNNIDPLTGLVLETKKLTTSPLKSILEKVHSPLLPLTEYLSPRFYNTRRNHLSKAQDVKQQLLEKLLLNQLEQQAPEKQEILAIINDANPKDNKGFSTALNDSSKNIMHHFLQP